MELSITTIVGVLLTVGQCAGVVLQNGLHLSKFSNPCSRKSGNFNNCLQNALREIIPIMSDEGIPEIDMLPLDPLVLREVFGKMDGPMFNVRATLRNQEIRGIRRVEINNLWTDFSNPSNIRIEMDLMYPDIKINGSYKADGVIATVNSGGKGPNQFTFTKIGGRMRIRGRLTDVDSIKYLQIINMELTPSTEKASVNLENIILGNKALSDAANGFFNFIWKTIYDNFLPFIRVSIDKVLTYHVNLATMRIPYNDLFPE